MHRDDEFHVSHSLNVLMSIFGGEIVVVVVVVYIDHRVGEDAAASLLLRVDS